VMMRRILTNRIYLIFFFQNFKISNFFFFGNKINKSL
jgi:hypothetical protein